MVTKIPPTQDAAGKKDLLEVLDKQKAVGGEGGWAFDSGCNRSGLRRVHVYVGPYYYDHGYSSAEIPCTIKRIFLEFHDPCNANSKLEPVPDGGYSSRDCAEKDTLCVFDVDDNDSIKRIDVWSANDLVVTAVQFRMKSGSVSQLFGSNSYSKKERTLPIWDTLTTPNTFQPRDPSWELVGIHGTYDDVVDRLGFTFAKVVSAFPTTTDEEATVVDSEWSVCQN